MVTEAEEVLAVLRPDHRRRRRRAATMGKPGRRDIGIGEPGSEATAGPPDAPPDARARIVALLGPTPVAIDYLIRLSAASSAVVQATLLELELAGWFKEPQRGGLLRF